MHVCVCVRWQTTTTINDIKQISVAALCHCAQIAHRIFQTLRLATPQLHVRCNVAHRWMMKGLDNKTCSFNSLSNWTGYLKLTTMLLWMAEEHIHVCFRVTVNHATANGWLAYSCVFSCYHQNTTKDRRSGSSSLFISPPSAVLSFQQQEAWASWQNEQSRLGTHSFRPAHTHMHAQSHTHARTQSPV